ncbi:MAG TPA: leucyl aminopeptidase family protein [Acetobacteraceae bacterium]|nr:leucyl aminopeptidase family protein [Acetobacteraceae bacterium]
MNAVRLLPAPPEGVPLAVPITAGSALPPGAAADGFAGRAGQACLLNRPDGRTMLVGLGPAATPEAAETAGALSAARMLAEPRLALDARGLDPVAAAAFVLGAAQRSWRYAALQTRADPDAQRLAAFDLVVGDIAAVRRALRAGRAAAEGACFARDLVAEPSNTLTPAGFVRHLRGLARFGLELEVIEGAALRRQGFGGLLAVGGGSVHPPCLAVLRWPGRIAAAPVAFVGKGITFDTGGIGIKPADRMWEMRADMAGAAACAGAMLALARRRSPAAAVAVMALAENATGGASYRPSDVLRSYAGRTVEVVDTDAEGRLVLADALAFAAARFRPRAMIDLATLTGSIVTALGHERAGLFGNDDALARQVEDAGAAVGEPVWRMPIGAAHRADLDSDIADLRHCVPGRMQPDACHAAAFLREFVSDIPWAHLDIAGMEAREEADDRHAAGPTGFGVRLLDRLVAARFESVMTGGGLTGGLNHAIKQRVRAGGVSGGERILLERR